MLEPHCDLVAKEHIAEQDGNCYAGYEYGILSHRITRSLYPLFAKLVIDWLVFCFAIPLLLRTGRCSWDIITHVIVRIGCCMTVNTGVAQGTVGPHTVVQAVWMLRPTYLPGY